MITRADLRDLPTYRDAFTDVGYWRDDPLHRCLFDAAGRRPDEVLWDDGCESLTVGDAAERARSLAGGLASLGIRRGDVVSFQLPNWVEAGVVFFATSLLGGILNPITPIYRRREVEFILGQSGAPVVFVPESHDGFDYRSMMERALDSGNLPDLKTVVTVRSEPEPEPNSPVETYESLVDESPSVSPGRDLDPNDPALLLYTSGTTGQPKGVLHTHNTILHENDTIIDLYELTGDDRIFMPAPVTHITGLRFGILLAPMIEGSTVFLDDWDPEQALKIIEREKLTFTVGATPFLKGLLESPDFDDRDTRSLRVFACGGADIPPELIERANRETPWEVIRVYGSTEFPTATSSKLEDPPDRKARTDGLAIGAVKVKIVDSRGREQPAGEPGEILLKGPERFLGYLKPSLNRDAFTEDDWYRSGDLGRVDEHGYLEVIGRKKDIIVRGGENISPKEVEDLLYEHPAVQECAIVPMPDEEMGEKGCAYVVTVPGDEISFPEMVNHLEGCEIARQKLPERLEIIEELPKTASGKVQKYKLRDRIERRLKEEPTP